MLDENINKNILLNLQRLRRQYEICLHHQDEAALLDLAHILRIWVDMKESVQYYINVKSPNTKFVSYTLTKQLLNCLRNKESIFVSLIDGVTFFKETNNSITLSPQIGKSIFLGIDNPKIDKKAGLTGDACYCYYAAFKNENNAKLLSPALKNNLHLYSTSKVSFAVWLNSEAARISIRDGEKILTKLFSREVMIKRTANILGGSHPLSNTVDHHLASTNSFDSFLLLLSQHGMDGNQLPYIILIKIAKDILHAFNS